MTPPFLPRIFGSMALALAATAGLPEWALFQEGMVGTTPLTMFKRLCS
jgi:hypothetical protein